MQMLRFAQHDSPFSHSFSVLGGDSDVGAVWAAVVEQGQFTAEAPESDPLTTSLGEGAQCFRGTINIAGRKPIRHLVGCRLKARRGQPSSS